MTHQPSPLLLSVLFQVYLIFILLAVHSMTGLAQTQSKAVAVNHIMRNEIPHSAFNAINSHSDNTGVKYALKTKVKGIYPPHVVRLVRRHPLRYRHFLRDVLRKQRDDIQLDSQPCFTTLSPELSSPPTSTTSHTSATSPASTTSSNTIASIVLAKVLEELETLKATKIETSGTQGNPCFVNGSWLSEVGGVILHIASHENSSNLKVNVIDATPPKSGFLNPKWSINGTAPFQKGGPFIINALNQENQTAAAFTGQCRFCSGGEMITGAWTISRLGRNCHDLPLATEHRGDIWRKENLSSSNITKSESKKGQKHAENSPGNKSNKTSHKRASDKEWMSP